MGRNATINIQNNTGYELIHIRDNISHGKFQKNYEPPTTITNGTTGTFKVGNLTGKLVGPKGTTTYLAQIEKNGVSIKLELVFFWNHPYSAATSVYSASSKPMGFSSFNLSPSVPQGHNQTVTIAVQFQNLNNIYDIDNWMASLDDSLNLSEISIPGTHDSGALIGGIAYECQSMDIATQLANGIRYLDIRCKKTDPGVLEIWHGTGTTGKDMGISFTTVMNDCISFLNTHPQEFIIMSLKQEDGDDIGAAFHSEIKNQKEKWYLESDIPALRDARGKIVLFRRFSAPGDLGINVLPWEDNSPSFFTDGKNIQVQDEYKVYFTAESINNKWNNIQNTVSDAIHGDKSVMYINYTSGATGIAPVDLATGESIWAFSEGMNMNLLNNIVGIRHQRLGIIVMDYPEYPEDQLIQFIIHSNF